MCANSCAAGSSVPLWHETSLFQECKKKKFLLIEFFHTRLSSCNSDNTQPLKIVLLVQYLFCLPLLVRSSCAPGFLNRKGKRSIFHAPICSQVSTHVSSWGILCSSDEMNVPEISCTSFQILHIIYMQSHNAIIFLTCCGQLKYVVLLV